jgi:hypothetical protein
MMKINLNILLKYFLSSRTNVILVYMVKFGYMILVPILILKNLPIMNALKQYIEPYININGMRLG